MNLWEKAVPSINCLFICCCDLNKKLETQYYRWHCKCQLIQRLPGSLRLNRKAWYSSDCLIIDFVGEKRIGMLDKSCLKQIPLRFSGSAFVRADVTSSRVIQHRGDLVLEIVKSCLKVNVLDPAIFLGIRHDVIGSSLTSIPGAIADVLVITLRSSI